MWKSRSWQGLSESKKKIGGNMHFSEIIELKFGKKLPYILCLLALFWNYGCLITSFFWGDSNNPCKDLLSPHSHNLCKNTSVLGGTVLKTVLTNSLMCSSRLSESGFHPSRQMMACITCQFLRVFENNATSSSLQTFDLFLVLMTTAMPCDVTVLKKR